jgi:hypothetical protein
MTLDDIRALEDPVSNLSKSRGAAWSAGFPALARTTIEKLETERIRSLAGLVRAAEHLGLDSVTPGMQLDTVIDRPAAQILLVLQLASEAPAAPRRVVKSRDQGRRTPRLD